MPWISEPNFGCLDITPDNPAFLEPDIRPDARYGKLDIRLSKRSYIRPNMWLGLNWHKFDTFYTKTLFCGSKNGFFSSTTVHSKTHRPKFIYKILIYPDSEQINTHSDLGKVPDPAGSGFTTQLTFFEPATPVELIRNPATRKTGHILSVISRLQGF